LLEASVFGLSKEVTREFVRRFVREEPCEDALNRNGLARRQNAGVKKEENGVSNGCIF
jgi:hypothetical protein